MDARSDGNMGKIFELYILCQYWTIYRTEYNMLNLLVMLDGEVRSRGQNLGSEVKTKGKTSTE